MAAVTCGVRRVIRCDNDPVLGLPNAFLFARQPKRVDEYVGHDQHVRSPFNLRRSLTILSKTSNVSIPYVCPEQMYVSKVARFVRGIGFRTSVL
jgi:hypothetical protein